MKRNFLTIVFLFLPVYAILVQKRPNAPNNLITISTPNVLNSPNTQSASNAQTTLSRFRNVIFMVVDISNLSAISLALLYKFYQFYTNPNWPQLSIDPLICGLIKKNNNSAKIADFDRFCPYIRSMFNLSNK